MIPFTTLLTQPKHAGDDLSASVDRHPRAFVPLWLALPLIPAICLFIGTTQVGWRLPGNDQTQYLSASSGALLALLFVSEAYLPKIPDEVRADSGVDRSIIRIHSERKWPERVVFDTNQPTIAPPQAAVIVASVPVPATVADVSAKARVREAYAQLPPPAQTQAQLSDPKKLEKPVQRQRRIAKRHAAPPAMLVAQQPQFGLFGNNTW